MISFRKDNEKGFKSKIICMIAIEVMVYWFYHCGYGWTRTTDLSIMNAVL